MASTPHVHLFNLACDTLAHVHTAVGVDVCSRTQLQRQSVSRPLLSRASSPAVFTEIWHCIAIKPSTFVTCFFANEIWHCITIKPALLSCIRYNFKQYQDASVDKLAPAHTLTTTHSHIYIHTHNHAHPHPHPHSHTFTPTPTPTFKSTSAPKPTPTPIHPPTNTPFSPLAQVHTSV